MMTERLVEEVARVKRLLICCLLLLLPTQRGFAVSADPGPVEVFVRVSANKAEEVPDCNSLVLWVDSLHSARSHADCTPLRGGTRTYRLRWSAGSKDGIEKVLGDQEKSGLVDWFEFSRGGMHLQAVATPSFYGELAAAMAGDETPSFVEDEALKLRNLLEIYKPRAVVTIAVIDSGVNFDSRRLRGLRASNAEELPGNGIDDDGNGYVDDIEGWDFVDEGYSSQGDDTKDQDNDPSDLMGHGTAVANIAAAVAGPQSGQWLRILPLRVASGAGGIGTISPFALAEAIRYAASMKVQVINLSIGSTLGYQVVTDAINEAVAQGTQVVVAAGNTAGSGVLFPASLTGVFAVGALDSNGLVWSGSARGPEISVFLRGTEMLQELGLQVSGLATNGTSYAAPQASADIAMLRAVAGNCESVLQTIREARPVDQKAEVWVAQLVDQFESNVQALDDLAQRWEANESLCGAKVTVAALLRTATD